MGQTATLYRIDKNDFPKIQEHPENISSFASKGDVSFQKTFEGFRFVLSKGQNKSNTELVQQIFYPIPHIGEEIDFDKLDMDNLPEDFNFESNAIYYNNPDKVTEIAAFLDSISIDKLEELFNADELNKEGIYPELWNTETQEDIAFNINHMKQEFAEMKAFFSKAQEEGDYVLNFIG
ncbi:hypothetical protein A4D02_03385 [Niastella koreensis]|uniref:DUF1877 domain-containing protein n=2 Tax=Niastella koreensis TaxID=354356 RepID=G8TMN0_NIAKG|nr:DUF1877 family protein [Niastella koreensis]AEW03051.1 protein of unknown function DUF1877 [Niastella koreensis GR20-10]OQP55366.1 hypothetical protein A4D02_03385 [Niastella koreensis]